ncbi:inositol-1,4,5-triphosphate-5-phosphatase, partial [Genlisea aurea]
SQLSWRRVVVRKWLNLASSNTDYSADTDSGSDSDSERPCSWPKKVPRSGDDVAADQFQTTEEDVDVRPRLRRRRNSETFRAHYIDTKEIRVCATTWNVGGRVPPDDIELREWLQTEDPADVYVIGLQEIIPLNAVNIFGAEDSTPVPRWEKIIRETLNQVPQSNNNYKSYSDPPSPSRFKPSDDAPEVEDEILFESGSDLEEEIFPLIEEPTPLSQVQSSSSSIFKEEPAYSGNPMERQFSSVKKLNRLNCLKIEDGEGYFQVPDSLNTKKLTRTLSGTERIGLSWPERPLHLVPLEKPNSLRSSLSFISPSPRLAESLMINRKRRGAYVRMVSKQMVGIFITIWVRRSLKRHIQNVNVSTVGVGAMGYIGNKGSIAVSMSIHQTLFCFICSHLAAGEKESDVQRRNAGVSEIHRRTRFGSLSSVRRIYDHERIIWLGDLNYRINLPYDRTRELIFNADWPQLVKQDQLVKELKPGGAFGGWSEATLSFAPTYKYEFDSDTYIHDTAKTGRRTPAWCDRILSFGTGMRQLSYRRTEVKLSDHRPVTAFYVVEVEVFCPKKLQRVLTFTDAEIEEQE